jgi:hypothetical protein
MATMLRSRHLQRCIVVPFTYIPTVQVNFPQVLILIVCVSVIAIDILTWCALTAEPINIFQGSYNTDLPPIRLSYHHGNHYNSVVDPRRQTVGAGLGFSSLRGVSFCFSKPLFVLQIDHDCQYTFSQFWTADSVMYSLWLLIDVISTTFLV